MAFTLPDLPYAHDALAGAAREAQRREPGLRIEGLALREQIGDHPGKRTMRCVGVDDACVVARGVVGSADQHRGPAHVRNGLQQERAL